MPTFPNYKRDDELERERLSEGNPSSSNGEQDHFQSVYQEANPGQFGMAPDNAVYPTSYANRAGPSGSKFQNINKYLNIQSGGNSKSNIFNKIGSEIDESKNKMQAIPEKFRTIAHTANIIPSFEDVNQIVTPPHNRPSNTDGRPTRLRTAEDLAPWVRNVEEKTPVFRQWLNQQYAGPSDLQAVPHLARENNSEVKKIEGISNSLKNRGGRYALLQNYFGRPNYTPGEKSLDNLLLERGDLPKESKRLQALAPELRHMSNENQAEAMRIAQDRKWDVDQSRGMAHNMLGVTDNGQLMQNRGRLGGLVSMAQIDKAAERDRRRAYYDRFLNDLQDTNAHPENPALSYQKLNKLLGEPEEGVTATNIYGKNINDPRYLEEPVYDVPEASFLNVPQQVALKALSKLANVEVPFQLPEVPAEVPKKDVVNFKKDLFKNDLAAEKTRYENELNEPFIVPHMENNGVPVLRNKHQWEEALRSATEHPFPSVGAQQSAGLYNQNVRPFLQRREAGLEEKYKPNRKLKRD